MRIPGGRWACGLLVALAVAGCGRTPVTPPGTGARRAAQSFFEALLGREWERAYSTVDPGSKARCNAERFSRLAENYRSGLGFLPEAVHVRACDEQGAEATVHVVLTGRAATKYRRFKDAVALRRGDQGWHVVLPPNFGRSRQP